MNDLLISCLSLAKRNNGMFKSQAQADFIISKANSQDGMIGHVTSGYNSCPVFATFDEKGILKIVKSTKKGDVIMFERKIEGQLTDKELKEIKHLEKLQKKIEKDYLQKKKSFEEGSYNGSGDVSTYSNDLIERYNRNQEERQERIASLKEKIAKIKTHNDGTDNQK